MSPRRPTPAYVTSVRSALADEQDISTLPTPPGYKPGKLRNLGESISYLIDPERFIAKRSKIFGPVFMTNIFFRPTVVIGGQPSVKDFINKEYKGKITVSSLPETFSLLHTKYGPLNLDSTGSEHKHRREFHKKLFSPDSVEVFMKLVDDELDLFMIELKDRFTNDPKSNLCVTPELSKFCLNLFAKIFVGSTLNDEQVNDFVSYNAGLLALSKNTKTWKNAEKSLVRLQDEIAKKHYRKQEVNEHDLTDVDKAIAEAYSFLIKYYPEEEHRELIGTSKVLMIWGAYIECASLMAKSIELLEKIDPTERSILVSNIMNESIDQKPKHLLARGVVRESLRLNPPAGGGFRISESDIEIAGYRIPSGTVISADPRIGNLDDSLYPDSSKALPERWVPVNVNLPSQKSSCPLRGSALNKGLGSWFPGGIGAHQCPGVPLSEAIASSFIIKFVETFERWEKVGGVDSKGDPKYVKIPIKIPVDNFAMRVYPRHG